MANTTVPTKAAPPARKTTTPTQEAPETTVVTEDVVNDTQPEITLNDDTQQTSDPVIQPVIQVEDPVKEKMVKVRVNANHKCSIGGVYYIFEENEVATVPANVKDVLRKAKLLAVL